MTHNDLKDWEKRTVGDVLKYAREYHGWTRAELAKRSGVGSNSISKYELAGHEGGQFPPLPKFAKLIAALRLDSRIIMSYATDDENEKTIIREADHQQDAEDLIRDFQNDLKESFSSPLKPVVFEDQQGNKFVAVRDDQDPLSLSITYEKSKQNEKNPGSLQTAPGSKSTLPDQRKEVDDG